MQCLILAGGLGTRMKAVSGDLPKALLPVGPETFIDWQLKWLAELGVDEVIMALGYGGEDIQRHIETKKAQHGYPMMKCRFDGKEFLGTGGAIRNASDLLRDHFVVTYGDSFLFVDVQKLFNAHLAGGRAVTFSIYQNKGAGDTSNVIFENGQIKRYDKFSLVPEMDHIDYGMSVLNKKWFLSETPPGKFDLAQVLTKASETGQMTAYVARERFREIGSPAGYRDFCELMASVDHKLSRLRARLS